MYRQMQRRAGPTTSVILSPLRSAYILPHTTYRMLSIRHRAGSTADSTSLYVSQSSRAIKDGSSAPDIQILSSIPVPRKRSTKTAIARKTAMLMEQKATTAVNFFILGLHNESWSSDQTWSRFVTLPKDSFKVLRNIDINRILSLIRGSKREYQSHGKPLNTTQTLKRMTIVFDKALEVGISPDRYTYQEMIAINVSLMDFKGANLWLEKMISSGIKPTIRPYRAILKGYSTVASEIENARLLWDKIKDLAEKDKAAMRETADPSDEINHSETVDGITELVNETNDSAKVSESAEPSDKSKVKKMTPAVVLDSKAYTCMISAECLVGDFARVVELVEEMSGAGIVADIVTRNVILRGIIRHKGIDSGLLELSNMKKEGMVPDQYTYNMLLIPAAKGQRLDIVKRLLKAAAEDNIVPSSKAIQMIPMDSTEILDIVVRAGEQLDVIRVYNTLIQAALRQNKFNEALVLFKNLRKNKVAPNVVTYSLLLDILNKAHRLDDAKRIYAEIIMDRRVEPDVYIYSSIIDNCGYHKDIKGMFEFKEEMTKRGILPSGYIYNSILTALSRTHPINLNLVTLTINELIAAAPTTYPETRTFNAVFSAFASYAQINELTEDQIIAMQDWYNDMTEKHHVIKDAYTYVQVINAFSACGCLDDALAVYRDMIKHSETDKQVLWRFTDSIDIMLELMQMCVRQKQFARTLELWRDFQNLGLSPTANSTALVLLALDQIGQIQTAKDIVKGMLTPKVIRGASKDAGNDDNSMYAMQKYQPQAINETVILIVVSMLIKHKHESDMMTMLELWMSSDSGSKKPEFMTSKPCKRTLSEKSAEKIFKILENVGDKAAYDSIKSQFTKFIEAHFPESIPV